MVLAHDLEPSLAAKLRTCTLSYAFSAELKTAFQGSDRYVPLDYKRDFESVREVAFKSGEAINRAGFERKKQESAK
jgi:phosphonate transport system substrate-binding protein